MGLRCEQVSGRSCENGMNDGGAVMEEHGGAGGGGGEVGEEQ